MDYLINRKLIVFILLIFTNVLLLSSFSNSYDVEITDLFRIDDVEVSGDLLFNTTGRLDELIVFNKINSPYDIDVSIELDDINDENIDNEALSDLNFFSFIENEFSDFSNNKVISIDGLSDKTINLYYNFSVDMVDEILSFNEIETIESISAHLILNKTNNDEVFIVPINLETGYFSYRFNQPTFDSPIEDISPGDNIEIHYEFDSYRDIDSLQKRVFLSDKDISKDLSIYQAENKLNEGNFFECFITDYDYDKHHSGEGIINCSLPLIPYNPDSLSLLTFIEIDRLRYDIHRNSVGNVLQISEESIFLKDFLEPKISDFNIHKDDISSRSFSISVEDNSIVIESGLFLFSEDDVLDFKIDFFDVELSSSNDYNYEESFSLYSDLIFDSSFNLKYQPISTQDDLKEISQNPDNYNHIKNFNILFNEKNIFSRDYLGLVNRFSEKNVKSLYLNEPTKSSLLLPVNSVVTDFGFNIDTDSDYEVFKSPRSVSLSKGGNNFDLSISDGYHNRIYSYKDGGFSSRYMSDEIFRPRRLGQLKDYLYVVDLSNVLRLYGTNEDDEYYLVSKLNFSEHSLSRPSEVTNINNKVFSTHPYDEKISLIYLDDGELTFDSIVYEGESFTEIDSVNNNIVTTSQDNIFFGSYDSDSNIIDFDFNKNINDYDNINDMNSIEAIDTVLIDDTVEYMGMDFWFMIEFVFVLDQDNNMIHMISIDHDGDDLVLDQMSDLENYDHLDSISNEQLPDDERINNPTDLSVKYDGISSMIATFYLSIADYGNNKVRLFNIEYDLDGDGEEDMVWNQIEGISEIGNFYPEDLSLDISNNDDIEYFIEGELKDSKFISNSDLTKSINEYLDLCKKEKISFFNYRDYYDNINDLSNKLYVDENLDVFCQVPFFLDYESPGSLSLNDLIIRHKENISIDYFNPTLEEEDLSIKFKGDSEGSFDISEFELITVEDYVYDSFDQNYQLEMSDLPLNGEHVGMATSVDDSSNFNFLTKSFFLSNYSTINTEFVKDDSEIDIDYFIDPILKFDSDIIPQPMIDSVLGTESFEIELYDIFYDWNLNLDVMKDFNNIEESIPYHIELDILSANVDFKEENDDIIFEDPLEFSTFELDSLNSPEDASIPQGFTDFSFGGISIDQNFDSFNYLEILFNYSNLYDFINSEPTFSDSINWEDILIFRCPYYDISSCETDDWEIIDDISSNSEERYVRGTFDSASSFALFEYSLDPEIEFKSPKNGDFFNYGEKSLIVEVNGTGIEIGEVVFNVDGSEYIYDIEGSDEVDCERFDDTFLYNCSLDIILDDGEYEFNVSAYDYDGEELVNHNSEIINFTIDTELPELNIISPIEGEYYNSLDVLLNISTQNNFGISEVWYYFNNSNNSYSQPENVLFEQGDNNLIVGVKDYAGNKKSKEIDFVIDTKPPNIEVVSPINNSYYSKDLIDVEFMSQDELSEIDKNWFEYNNSKFEYNEFESFQFDEGENNITFWSNDSLGNVANKTISFIVDTILPEIHVVSPLNNSYYNSSNLLIEFDSTDKNDIDENWYQVNDDEIVFEDEDNIELENGKHNISFFSNDSAGNVAEKKINFIVDTKNPHLDIISPLSQNYTKSRDILLNFSTHDELSGIDSIWYNFEGKDRSYYFPFKERFYDGENELNVWVNDSAGNVNSSSISFNVTAPVTYDKINTKLPYIYNDSNIYQFNVTIDDYSDSENVKLFLKNSSSENYSVYDMNNDGDVIWSFSKLNLSPENYKYFFWANSSHGIKSNISSVSSFSVVENITENQKLVNESFIEVSSNINDIIFENNKDIRDISIPYNVTSDINLYFNEKSDNSVNFFSDTSFEREINNDRSIITSFLEDTNMNVEKDEWDGNFDFIQEIDLDLSGIDVKMAMEIGVSNSRVSFDKPVKIKLPNMSNYKAGFVDGDELYEINITCDNYSRPKNIFLSGPNNQCFFKEDDDLFIFTHHFSNFIAYELVEETSDDDSDDSDDDDSGDVGGAPGGFPSTEPDTEDKEEIDLGRFSLGDEKTFNVEENQRFNFEINSTSFNFSVFSISENYINYSFLKNSSMSVNEEVTYDSLDLEFYGIKFHLKDILNQSHANLSLFYFEEVDDEDDEDDTEEDLDDEDDEDTEEVEDEVDEDDKDYEEDEGLEEDELEDEDDADSDDNFLNSIFVFVVILIFAIFLSFVFVKKSSFSLNEHFNDFKNKFIKNSHDGSDSNDESDSLDDLDFNLDGNDVQNKDSKDNNDINNNNNINQIAHDNKINIKEEINKQISNGFNPIQILNNFNKNYNDEKILNKCQNELSEIIFNNDSNNHLSDQDFYQSVFNNVKDMKNNDLNIDEILSNIKENDVSNETYYFVLKSIFNLFNVSSILNSNSLEGELSLVLNSFDSYDNNNNDVVYSNDDNIEDNDTNIKDSSKDSSSSVDSRSNDEVRSIIISYKDKGIDLKEVISYLIESDLDNSFINSVKEVGSDIYFNLNKNQLNMYEDIKTSILSFKSNGMKIDDILLELEKNNVGDEVKYLSRKAIFEIFDVNEIIKSNYL